MKKTINDVFISGKCVLLRADFNVPIKNNIIQDNTRIVATIPTIKQILAKNPERLIIFSHLGRVKTDNDKLLFSLKPVAIYLEKLLNIKVCFVPFTSGPKVKEFLQENESFKLFLFENTRFEDLNAKRESKNNPELGKFWASLGSVFINDAFGTAHRSHASNVGIATYINESAIGPLILKETMMLTKAVQNPKHPLVVIIGGAKVSDKILVLENMLKIADKIVIGGGMAYTFLKSQGHKIGSSLYEEGTKDFAKKLLQKHSNKLVLPVDHLCAQQFANVPRNKILQTESADIPNSYMGLDIGKKTIENYQKIIKSAHTIIWNGPMGVFELDNFAAGTKMICQAIASNKDAFSIVGGGDSAAAAVKFGYQSVFTHISTGGGASLCLLEGNSLPAIEAIDNKN